jgi:hypothetical protein
VAIGVVRDRPFMREQPIGPGDDRGLIAGRVSGHE